MAPTLTDQIGAMSVVDKLRFENLRVQDFMDAAEQKERLVEKIAAAYQAEGTNVPLAVIQDGVEQWYQNRLAFKLSHIPWYFSIYIRRDKWIKPALLIATFACFLAAAGVVVSLYEHKKAVEQRLIIESIVSEAAVIADRAIGQLSLEEDKHQVRAILSRISRSVDNSELPDKGDLEQLKSIEMLSKTQIRLLIGTDNTQKSGVEREFSGSGGKAWYVIAQSVDEAQVPVKLRIKSVENGKERLADIFGVRVTRERYEKIKKDKLEDGIIDAKLIGIKPVGQLAFQFEAGFSPEYILEW